MCLTSLEDGAAHIGQNGCRSPVSAMSGLGDRELFLVTCQSHPPCDAPFLPQLKHNPLRLYEVLRTEAEPELLTHHFLSMRQKPGGVLCFLPAEPVKWENVVKFHQALGINCRSKLISKASPSL